MTVKSVEEAEAIADDQRLGRHRITWPANARISVIGAYGKPKAISVGHDGFVLPEPESATASQS